MTDIVRKDSAFRNSAAEFVYTRTYSRWIDDKNRRETWDETVDRYITFMKEELGDKVPDKVFRKMRDSIYNLHVMPSMRALWAAGPAARADNTCLFNCSYRACDSVDAFAECLYILMCGTGFGFSVRHTEVDQLPEIPAILGQTAGVYVVEDSRRGWADSLNHLLTALYAGKNLEMDYTGLREKGARLKTMGGRSSGPEPLIKLHNYVRELFEGAQGRKMSTIECHDLFCQIAEIVVVGGVRRSSEVSLSDLTDNDMRGAKVWPFPLRRAMANNSAIYNTKPTATEFLMEWASLAASGTGERGIFNLGAAKKSAPKRRNATQLLGGNPCMEIILRSKEFCNLSEIIVKMDDDLDSLLEKATTATWIGVMQSTFDYYPYLSKEWKENSQEERLLGVSITGQMDNKKILTADALKALKSRVNKTAKHAAKLLGINVPSSTTCVKPSGTVSQVVDSSSGIHPRHAEYYIRRYRIASTDPLYEMLKAQGMKPKAENGQSRKYWNKAAEGDTTACPIYVEGEDWSADKVNTWVLEFPMHSPKTAVMRNEMSVIEQLEWYKHIQTNWCEHNASMTVSVKDEEWFEAGNWVFENWDSVSGISFLPYDGGKYELAPYEDITKEKYIELMDKMPKLDYSQLSRFETEDNTTGAKSVACSGGTCDIV